MLLNKLNSVNIIQDPLNQAYDDRAKRQKILPLIKMYTLLCIHIKNEKIFLKFKKKMPKFNLLCLFYINFGTHFWIIK